MLIRMKRDLLWHIPSHVYLFLFLNFLMQNFSIVLNLRSCHIRINIVWMEPLDLLIKVLNMLATVNSDKRKYKTQFSLITLQRIRINYKAQDCKIFIYIIWRVYPFSRFLSLVERHFKSIAYGINFVTVTDAIPPMMQALRMIWIISRHYNKDERMVPLMKRIAWNLSDRVARLIDVNNLYK